MASVYNQGLQIHYETAGQGKPLVLHHAFGENREVWRDSGYVAALQRDYQLILIDSRGHGASDKPHDPATYGLEERAGDVVAVLDHLGLQQAHYFGYSLGGWIGFGLAKYAPERLRSLTLGGITPYGQNMAPYREMLKADLKTCAALLERAAGAPLSEKQQKLFYQNDIQALRAAYHQDRPDLSASLPAINVPCLLFAGEADPLHPLLERCAAELPQATFYSIPGLNHIQLGLQLEKVLPHFNRFLAEVDHTPAFHPLLQPAGSDLFGK